MNTILRHHDQARCTPHVAGTLFHCSQCHKDKPVKTNGGTGYAVDLGGELICYDCCTINDRAALKDRKPFVAYVGTGATTITNWTGATLATITRSRACRLTRQSFTHGKYISCIHAVDVHGGHWFGRGSEGIAIKLRPCKS